MSKKIIFDDGTAAVVYKHTDIRTKLTMKQAYYFMMAQQIINVPKKKELLIILPNKDCLLGAS